MAGSSSSAPHIIIATGGRPLLPPIPGAELGITSDGFFELPRRPQRVAIVGSGYIAIELTGIFAAIGSNVTLVLRGQTMLNDFDSMIGESMSKILSDDGVSIVRQAWPAALASDAAGHLDAVTA